MTLRDCDFECNFSSQRRVLIDSTFVVFFRIVTVSIISLSHQIHHSQLKWNEYLISTGLLTDDEAIVEVEKMK
jgi:hypothetical protein